jgi:cold-inducible RNA-binding protein
MNIYVGNLAFTVDDAALRAAFEVHGAVSSAQVVMDRETGRSRGFGFVEMENADKAATELNGKDFGGRNLTVNEAKQREERAPRSGGRGGYGGGGNYNR